MLLENENLENENNLTNWEYTFYLFNKMEEWFNLQEIWQDLQGMAKRPSAPGSATQQEAVLSEPGLDTNWIEKGFGAF